MSHVAVIDLEVKDLGCLDAACKRLGLELVPGQSTYRWFGQSVGDYPLPDGFTKDDLGKCDHAIRVPNDAEAYEVGVVRRQDASGAVKYVLLWDFFDGGYGLEAKVGANCCKLRQSYGAAIAKKHAQLQGFSVHEKLRQDGSLQLTLSK